jgi:hypothetical protein
MQAACNGRLFLWKCLNRAFLLQNGFNVGYGFYLYNLFSKPRVSYMEGLAPAEERSRAEAVAAEPGIQRPLA